jgi:hypothetical protein
VDDRDRTGQDDRDADEWDRPFDHLQCGEDSADRRSHQQQAHHPEGWLGSQAAHRASQACDPGRWSEIDVPPALRPVAAF